MRRIVRQKIEFACPACKNTTLLERQPVVFIPIDCIQRSETGEVTLTYEMDKIQPDRIDKNAYTCSICSTVVAFSPKALYQYLKDHNMLGEAAE